MFEVKKNVTFTNNLSTNDPLATQSGYILCPMCSMRDICTRIKSRQIFQNALELSLSGKQCYK